MTSISALQFMVEGSEESGHHGLTGEVRARSMKDALMAKRAAHPGEILKEELDEIGISPTELARRLCVSANRLSQIINGKRSITGDTALRLGHWFGTDPRFWMNLQIQFDLLAADRAVGEAIRSLPTRTKPSSGGTQTTSESGNN